MNIVRIVLYRVKRLLSDIRVDVVLLTAALLIAYKITHLADIPADLIDRVAPTTVTFLLGERPIASGSFVRTPKGSLVILTNYHVCAAYNNSPTAFQVLDGPVITAYPLKKDITVDLCIIDVPSPKYALFPAIDIGSHNDRFQHIMIIGHPLGGPLNPSFGYILDRGYGTVAFGVASPEGLCFNGLRPIMSMMGVMCAEDIDMVFTNVVTYPGNSGSPAVDEDGKLIGVLNSGSNETHYGNIIPLDSVKSFLKGL